MLISNINRYLLSIYVESALRVLTFFNSLGVWNLGISFWCFFILVNR